MNTVAIYRCFRTRSHLFYDGFIDDMSLLAIENVVTPYIGWMLNVPTMFTKEAIIPLTRELSRLPYSPHLEALIMGLEAYPASFHNGATRELGILVSFNGEFKLGLNEKQANWKYEEGHIVGRHGRRHFYRRDLPPPPTRSKGSIESFRLAQESWRAQFS